MNKRRLGVVAGMAIALAAVGGVTAVATIGASNSDQKSVMIHQMSAEYPTFDSAAALAKASAVVVRATAVEVGPSYRDIPAGLDTRKLPAHKAAQVGTMQHDVVFRVDEVLRGAATTGATVRVVHLGGQVGQDRYVMEAEPSSTVGSSYLLFLTPLSGGKFGIVGGPQGRYLVEKGTVTVLNTETGDQGVGRQLNGATLATVAGRLGS